MIITVRYRDIPFEEAVKCCGPDYHNPNREAWERRRGTLVQIETPPHTIPQANKYWACEGPYYCVVGTNGLLSVCPHLAEIGD